MKFSKNSICQSNLPNKIYTVKNYISGTDYELYLFAGTLDENLFNLLKSICEEKKELLGSRDDRIKLQKILGKSITLQRLTEENIYIVDNNILPDDTIANIKNKIYIEITNIQKKIRKDLNLTNWYTECQYLWFNQDKIWDFNNIYDLFYNFAENNQVSKKIFVEFLINITDRSLQDQKEADIIDELPEYLDLPKFIRLFKNINSLQRIKVPLGFNISNNNSILYYDADPVKYLHKFNDTDLLKMQTSKIIWENNRILEDYGEISDNVINLNNYPDFISWAKVNDSNINYTDENFYYKFIKKYWPGINFDNFTELNFSDEKSDFKNIDKFLNNTNKFWKLYFNQEGEINYLNYCGLIEATIHVNYPSSNDFINLKKIFDIYSLSEEIPFIKYKLKHNLDSLYKIYKPITEEGSDKYIAQKEVENWKKNYIYEKQTGKLRSISNTNCLILKILFNTVNIEKLDKKLDNLIKLKSNAEKIKDFTTIRKLENDIAKIQNEKIQLETIMNKIYLTLFIFSDGRLEIKLVLKETDKANLYTLQNAIEIINKVIHDINKINYSDDGKKILLPDHKFLNRKSFNTELKSMTTYVITENLPEIDRILANLETVSTYLYPLLKTQNEKKKSKNELNLVYRRVNEFENMDSESRYITELYKGGTTDQEKIIQILLKSFSYLDKQKAYDLYAHWYANVKAEIHLTSLGMVAKMKSNPGIQLNFNLYDKEKIKIIVDSIESINQLNRVNYYINSLFNFSINENDYIKIEQIFKKFNKSGESIKQLIDVYDSDDEHLKEVLEEIELSSGDELSDNSDDDLAEEAGDFLEGLLGELDELEDDEENVEEVPVIQKPVVKEKNEKHDTPKKMILKEFKTDVQRYFNTRLRIMDPGLFKPKPGDNEKYTTKCQAVQNKQPVSVTKEELEKIDSFDEQLSEKIGKNVKSYSWSLPSTNREGYGTPGYKNYFICPLVWCINCELSLPFDKDILNPDGLSGKESNLLLDSICPKCGGKVIKDFKNRKEDETLYIRTLGKDKKIDENSEITDMDKPYFLKIRSPEGYCWPCCGKADKRENKETLECLGLNKEVEVKEDKENKNLMYILDASKILDNDRLGILPKELSILFGNKRNSVVHGTSKLKNKATEFLRLGNEKSSKKSFINILLQVYNFGKSEQINLIEFIDILLNNINPLNFIKSYDGDLITLFNIRNYNFISDLQQLTDLITWLDLYPEIKDLFTIPVDLSEIVQYPFSNIHNTTNGNSVDLKKKLNLLFVVKNSFENFKRFLINDNLINHEYLWMLFTYPIPNIFPDGLNMFFFEINQYSIDSHVSLLCPKIGKPERYYNETKPIIYILKKNRNYELIVKVNAIEGKLNIKLLHDARDDYHIIFGLEHYFIKSCKELKTEFELQYNAQPADSVFEELKRISKLKDSKTSKLKNSGFKPIYQIIDNYFKICGIITKNNTFVPTFPSEILDNLSIKSNIGINTLTPQNFIKQYNHLLALTKNNIFSVPYQFIIAGKDSAQHSEIKNYKVVDYTKKLYTKDWIMGIEFNNGLIIPLKMERDKESLKLPKNDKFYDKLINDEIFYGIQYTDQRMIDINKLMFSEESYQLLRYEISRYLNSNSNKIYNKLSILEKKLTDITKIIDTYQDDTSNPKLLGLQLNKNNIEISLKKLNIQLESFKSISDIKQEIYTILNDIIITDIEKRNKLFDIVEDIINTVAVTKTFESDLFDNSKVFDMKNKRTRCLTHTSVKNCDSDIFCSWNVSKCLNAIPESDIVTGQDNYKIKVIYKLIDELVRNKFKRNELLERKISELPIDIQDCEGNSCIFTEQQLLEGGIDNMYNEGKQTFINNTSIFELENPLTERELQIELSKKTDPELIYCQYQINELSEQWHAVFPNIIKYFTTDPNSQPNPGCSFDTLAKILNNHPVYTGKVQNEFTGLLVRKQIAEAVYSITNYKKLSNLYNSISNYDHWCTYSDLEIASFLYNFIFIIIPFEHTPKSKIMQINSISNIESVEYIILFEYTIPNSNYSTFDLIFDSSQPSFHFTEKTTDTTNELPPNLLKLPTTDYNRKYIFIDTSIIDFKKKSKDTGYVIKGKVLLDTGKKKITLIKEKEQPAIITKNFLVKEGKVLLDKGKLTKNVSKKKNKDNNNNNKNSKKNDDSIYADIYLKNGNKAKGKKAKAGKCIFPFKFENKVYNECLESKSGNWCATTVDTAKKGKTNAVTYGYCLISPFTNEKFTTYAEYKKHIDSYK